MNRYLYLAFLIFVPALLRAEPPIAQIAFRNDAWAGNDPSPPIVIGGVAYWHDVVNSSGGDRILSYPGGLVASDDRTNAVAGDFPVGFPEDDFNGNLLVLGRYFEDNGDGFSILNTLVQFPGGTDLITPFSAFPDGIPSNDSIQIQAGLYDSDGSIVFAMRQVAPPNVLFTALARYKGGSITILVKSGETPFPGGGTNTFTTVGEGFSTQGGTTFFYGEGLSGGTTTYGVYQLTGGIITKVLENLDPWPAGTGTVGILGSSDVGFANEGQDVAIATTGAVFKRVGGIWSLIAKADDPIPDGNGVFYDYAAPSIHNGVVLFYGERNNPFALPVQVGLYLQSAAGGYTPVADLNDNFNGMTVDYMLVPDYGGRYWDGEDVAFSVDSPNLTNTADYYAVSGPGGSPPMGGTTNTLHIGSFSPGSHGGTPSFSFQTGSGVSYHIQVSSNLMSWTSITQFTGDGTITTISNLPAGGKSQFYRVASP